MQTHAAVFRTGSVLLEGCQKIDEIYNQTEDLKVTWITDSAIMCVLNNPYRIYAFTRDPWVLSLAANHAASQGSCQATLIFMGLFFSFLIVVWCGTQIWWKPSSCRIFSLTANRLCIVPRLAKKAVARMPARTSR